MSIFRFLVSISFLILFSLKVSASSTQTFYFTTDWGEEVQVDVDTSGNPHFPRFLIYNDHGSDSFELTRQYVKATLEQRNYIYGYEETCDGCAIGYDIGKVNRGQKIKIPVTSKKSVINKTVEGAASQLGSRVADSVLDLLGRTNEAVDYSLLMVITNDDDVPTGMCEVAEGSCKLLNDVVFTQFDDGSWGISYPAPTLENEMANSIHDALTNYRARLGTRVKCRTSYTGSGDRLTAQVVCFTIFTSY